MSKKVLLAAMLGGLALFAWGFVSHVLLPLGQMGLTTLPNEEAVMAAIGDSATEQTLYFFPAAAAEGEPTGGPGGLIAYDPDGVTPAMAKELATQFLADVGVALFAVLALSLAAGSLRSYVARVAFVTMLSALPILAVLTPYWNWYGFSCAFTIAGVVEQVVGFLVVGLVGAAIVKSPPLL